PHRFTRLRDHMGEFAGAFNDADIVYVAPVYPAGEHPIAGVHAAALVEGIKARGHRSAHQVQGASELAATLAGQIRPGDMVVCLGAGDITKWAAGLGAGIAAARAEAAGAA
ncbi:MAG TPA: UDP-N-acetylmuramate--L-alanine ligase, partial [Novosphingobium sp.]|nr:UDP-N-acetylmuramate--L-alanine ligase [Novosphingobium sp.]